MGLKQHTIILVPHARAQFRKWRVTNRQLIALAGVVVLLTTASIYTTWSFLTNTVDKVELERVRTENDELRQVNQSFEGSIRELNQQLEDFETRTRQLAIVAGLDSLAGGEAGIGGSSPYATGSQAELDGLLERAEVLDSGLQRVQVQLDEQILIIDSTPSITPVRGILTSGFGYRRDPISGQRANHQGIDIATAPGRPVRSAADGIILRAGRVGELGKAVYVSHGYGLTTRYGHLSDVSVTPGQRVSQGDVLGEVGSTGKATGYHLHYEVRHDGKAVDPRAYLLDWSSSSR